MHRSIPAVPRPTPPPHPPPCTLLRGICPPCQCRGWGLFKFCAARGPGICQPWGFFKAFVTCYQNKTTQRILLEKQAYWLIWQGQEKLKRVVKACSRFYACISSLLIKPELHSEIRELSTWINILWLINQISFDIIRRTSFHIYNLFITYNFTALY